MFSNPGPGNSVARVHYVGVTLIYLDVGSNGEPHMVIDKRAPANCTDTSDMFRCRTIDDAFQVVPSPPFLLFLLLLFAHVLAIWGRG